MKMTEKYSMAYWQATLLLFIYFDAQDGSLIKNCKPSMVMHMFNPCSLGENWEFEDSLEYIWGSS